MSADEHETGFRDALDRRLGKHRSRVFAGFTPEQVDCLYSVLKDSDEEISGSESGKSGRSTTGRFSRASRFASNPLLDALTRIHGTLERLGLQTAEAEVRTVLVMAKLWQVTHSANLETKDALAIKGSSAVRMANTRRRKRAEDDHASEWEQDYGQEYAQMLKRLGLSDSEG